MTLYQKMKINFHVKMLIKSCKFGKKRIIYHENAHLLFASLLNFTCEYVDYTVNFKITSKGGLGAEFESKAFAYISLPVFLTDYYTHLKQGGTPQQFASISNISLDNLNSLTSYNLIYVYAGYEAERYFFNKWRYIFIRYYDKMYSQDLTKKNIQEDEFRANDILTTLGFNESQRKKIREEKLKMIRRFLGDRTMQKIFNHFYRLSESNSILKKEQIEEELSKFDFQNWATSLIDKYNKSNQ